MALKLTVYLSYNDFDDAYDEKLKLVPGFHPSDLNTKLYRCSKSATMIKIGGNLSFWQTVPNLEYLSESVYIITLGNLMACSDVRFDTFGFTQGAEKGISIVAHHGSAPLNGNPIPAGKFKKLDNLLVGFSLYGDRVVNKREFGSHLPGAIFEAINVRWYLKGDQLQKNPILPKDTDHNKYACVVGFRNS